MTGRRTENSGRFTAGSGIDTGAVAQGGGSDHDNRVPRRNRHGGVGSGDLHAIALFEAGIDLDAFDMGITHYDLANNYGPPPGSAERNFGSIFARDLRAYRDEILISTKAGYWMWPGPYGE